MGRRRRHEPMKITCADCGCLVDRGVIVRPCDSHPTSLLRAPSDTEVKRVKCSCCGEEREPDNVAALLCYDDVTVCRVCAGWLRSQTGTPDSTPILRAGHRRGRRLLCERRLRRPILRGRRVCFRRAGGRERLRSRARRGPETDQNHAGCYLIVRDVDAWHSEL
jgi:hypothetical protein